MAKLSTYLDRRHTNKAGECSLKLSIRHKSTSAFMSLGIRLRPEHWDKSLGKVIRHPRAVLINSFVAKRIADIEAYMITKRMQNESIGRSALEIKKHIEGVFFREVCEDLSSEEETTYIGHFMSFIDRKRGKTRLTYEYTLGRLRAFDAGVHNRTFEEINKAYLERFGLWCREQGVSINTTAIHYRNMRSVFNDALDNDLTTHYPFRRFKVRTVQTAKRSLGLAELRRFWSSGADDTEQRAIDIFKLMFFLLGINMVDLARLKDITSDGRVEFNRSKTGRHYSIKVEPEALEIINRYRGSGHLLYILDRWKSHDDFRRKLNKTLQRIGGTEQGKQGSKIYRPLHPDITTYWARHTWATIAAALDIPKETIAQALGHGGNSVTDIYIDFDRRKVDEANRRVIDYVLGLGEWS